MVHTFLHRADSNLEPSSFENRGGSSFQDSAVITTREQ